MCAWATAFVVCRVSAVGVVAFCLPKNCVTENRTIQFFLVARLCRCSVSLNAFCHRRRRRCRRRRTQEDK